MTFSKKLLFVAFVFFTSSLINRVFAQDKIDSLLEITKTGTNPEQKAKAYIELARKSKFSQKKIYYLEEGLKYSRENHLDKFLWEFNYRLGSQYLASDKTRAKHYYLMALELGDTNTIDYAKNLSNLAYLYMFNRNFDSSEYFYNKAITLKKRLLKGNPDSIAIMKSLGKTYTSYGGMLLNRTQYKRATEVLYKALEMFEAVKDTSTVASTYLNIGVIHFYYHDYDNALDEFKKALKFSSLVGRRKTVASAMTNIGSIYKIKREWDKADSMYRAALMIRLEIGPKSSVAGLYENLGIIAKAKGEFDRALEYFNKSLNIKLQMNSKMGLASLYANLGNLYYGKGNLKKAESALLKALEYAKDMKNYEAEIDILSVLSDLYEDKGNYKKALKFYKKYSVLNDSVHSLKNRESINMLKEKFESAQKDRVISEYKQKQALDKLMSEKQKLNNRLLATAILFILIIFAFVVILINNKRKNERRMFEKNAEISRQKMLDLVKEQEMNSVNSFIMGQEKERSRIASDLHDRLGSLLSAVKLHFSSLEPNFEKDKELKENFDYAIDLLDKSVTEVRSVSHNLAKEALTEFGLVGAVENLIAAINSAGSMKVVFYNSGFDHRLPYEYEIEIYRILQELVTNAIKHAKANEIVIQFLVDGDNLTITVEDDGVGFDIKKVKTDGLGMKNIFNRTANLDGKYTVDSSPGNGTSYIFEIPIPEEYNKS